MKAQRPRLLRLPGVFAPLSDSWMLADAVAGEVRPGEDAVLELCAGAGGAALSAALAGARRVTAVDVSRRAVAAIKLNALLNRVRVEARRGDLFAPVRGRRFDLIAANPPYVPTEREAPLPARGARRALDAGLDGRELIDRIIAGAPAQLQPGGRLLIVHSSLCNTDATVAAMTDQGLQAELVGRREGPLGPVVLARAAALEANNVLARGQRTEELVVIAGHAPG